MTETKAKESPILFSAPMVRAILEGRKTQTRRVLNPQPSNKRESELEPGDVIWWGGEFQKLSESQGRNEAATGRLNARTLLPRYPVGTHLWVRETWARRTDVSPETEREKCIHYLKYRADADDLEMEWHNYNHWRPSIFMPRWASRITLEVTGVKVERLQDISGEDCESEGILYDPDEPEVGPCGADRDLNLIERFSRLWESINGKGSWAKNPFVWCYSFKRIMP